MGKRVKKTTVKTKIIISILALLVIAASVSAYFLIAGKKTQQGPLFVLNKSGQTSGVNFDKPVRILVLGSDSRSQNMRGSRSDANMLVQINPDKSANIVSFPRDSYVPIACGGSGKINSALAFGGPECTVETVENYSGLKIHYYMVTPFPGFTGIINAIGGLKFHFDKPLQDSLAGAHFSAGTKTLRGAEALAVARSRHVAGGDFARQARQQELAVAIYKQERRRLGDMGMMLRLVPMFIKRTNTNLSSKELFRLIHAIFSVKPDNIDKAVLQGGTGSGGGASVVHLNRTFANQQFAKFKAKE